MIARLLASLAGVFVAALLALWLLGCFDAPKPTKPIEVKTVDCRTQLLECGQARECWSAYHECIGFGGIGDAI